MARPRPSARLGALAALLACLGLLAQPVGAAVHLLAHAHHAPAGDGHDHGHDHVHVHDHGHGHEAPGEDHPEHPLTDHLEPVAAAAPSAPLTAQFLGHERCGQVGVAPPDELGAAATDPCGAPPPPAPRGERPARAPPVAG